MEWPMVGVLVVAAFAAGYLGLSLLLLLRDMAIDGVHSLGRLVKRAGARPRRSTDQAPASGPWKRGAFATGLWVLGVVVGFGAGLLANPADTPAQATPIVGREAFEALESREGLTPARLGLKWGFVDHDFDFVIPARYSGARHFSEGLAAVCEERRWGYINAEGETVIPCRFMAASDFHDGRALVATMDGALYEIDRDGQRLTKVEDAPICFDEEL